MPAQQLEGDIRLPIYQRLADTLRGEIVDRSRLPGDRVPSENVLAEEYGVSTGTARKAIDVLVNENLMERFHGRGTFVRRPNFDRSLFRFFRFRGPTGEWTMPQSRILKRVVEPVPSYVARELRLDEGTPAISMSRLRLVDGIPVLVEEIWLPLERFKAFLETPTEEIGDLLYPIYDTLCGQLIARAEETLMAELACSAIARPLRIKIGDPVIVIDRLAKGYDDTPLEWRRSRGCANQFHYHTEIR